MISIIFMIAASYTYIGLIMMFLLSEGTSMREVVKIWLGWPYYYVKIALSIIIDAMKD